MFTIVKFVEDAESITLFEDESQIKSGYRDEIFSEKFEFEASFKLMIWKNRLYMISGGGTIYRVSNEGLIFHSIIYSNAVGMENS